MEDIQFRGSVIEIDVVIFNLQEIELTTLASQEV